MADTVVKLTKQQWTDLLIAERKLSDVFSEFDKAASCGIDCDNLRAMVQEQLDIIKQIKANYNPNQ